MRGVPKLWDETIEEHRRAVREATLDATAALVAEHGLRGVTMSAIAERAGIGRATLYKYFPDAEAALSAWHERQIGSHLDQLRAVRDQPGDPTARLHAVLEAYALIQHERHDAELSALLHQGAHVDNAHGQLRRLVEELLAEAAEAGGLRDDVPTAELATYCVYSLSAAGNLPSKAAVRRLVEVTMAGLQPAS